MLTSRGKLPNCLITMRIHLDDQRRLPGSGDEVSARSASTGIRTVASSLKAGHIRPIDLKRSIYTSKMANSGHAKPIIKFRRNQTCQCCATQSALAKSGFRALRADGAATLSRSLSSTELLLLHCARRCIAAAADYWSQYGRPCYLCSVGTTSVGYIEAMRAIRNVSRVTIVARNHARERNVAGQAEGLPARVGNRDDVRMLR